MAHLARCALVTFTLGAVLALAARGAAEDATTVDLSTQPHLKAWSNIVRNTAKRFIVLTDFDNDAGPGRRAVLDRETGLVWEQSPQTTNHTWLDARFQCANKNIGGRKGWRLPSFAELMSLIDPSGVVPALPPGNPFLNTQPGSYWSATTSAESAQAAWYVVLNTGELSTIEKTFSFGFAWCVRGGMNADQY